MRKLISYRKKKSTKISTLETLKSTTPNHLWWIKDLLIGHTPTFKIITGKSATTTTRSHQAGRSEVQNTAIEPLKTLGNLEHYKRSYFYKQPVEILWTLLGLFVVLGY